MHVIIAVYCFVMECTVILVYSLFACDLNFFFNNIITFIVMLLRNVNEWGKECLIRVRCCGDWNGYRERTRSVHLLNRKVYVFHCWKGVYIMNIKQKQVY